MSESGGPIFEGSSATRPEKPKSGVVEKVKAAFARKGEEIRNDFEKRKDFGQEKQRRVIERYQKIVGGMNESWIKSAAKWYEPVVRLDAKVKGISAAVVDTSLKSMWKYGRNLLSVSSLTSGIIAFNAGKAPENRKALIGGIVGAVGFGAGAVGADIAKMRAPESRPLESVIRKHEDVKDYLGLKGVDILNKMIGRKPEAMPA